MSLRPYAWMLCGCFWFSVMATLAHHLGGRCDWQLVAVARSGLATAFALTLALATGAKLVFARPGVLWVRSVAGSCSMIATFYALTHMPVSDVLTLTNTFPVWVALLSWPLAGERPTVGVWGAVLAAVAGVALTQQPHLLDASVAVAAPPLPEQPYLLGTPLGAWAALAASVFTAVAMMGLNRLKGVSSLGVVVHFSAVSTLFGLAAFFRLPRHFPASAALETPTLWFLVGVGATATIGQVFLTLAFRSGTATKVSVVGLSQVVMVMAAEAAGDRAFGWGKIAGTVLVLGPTAWLMVRDRRRAVADAKRGRPSTGTELPPDSSVVTGAD